MSKVFYSVKQKGYIQSTIKNVLSGCLLHVDISDGKSRLGGSALAQCYKQIGNESPDLDHPKTLSAAFNVTQKLISERKITAGHDVSDGGLVTCLLEMAFAGNAGITVDLKQSQDADVIGSLFAEELGLVLEVAEADVKYVTEEYFAVDVSCNPIGQSKYAGPESLIQININESLVLEEKMVILRDMWEETSFQLERRQANPDCVRQEQEGLKSRQQPRYKLTFKPDIVHILPQAVLGEEGSNSDREMSVALIMAGFEVWDVSMQDLCAGSIKLDTFHGLVFVGGFSYADVLGSAKGWAASAMFHPSIRQQFKAFKDRANTFSFGVCNGCQLMGLLGWVAPSTESEADAPSAGVFLDHNDSERFECRFVSVRVDKSPSIMFTGMEGTIFGMWSANGEGKMVFRSPEIYNRMTSNHLVPVRYVNDEGEPTTVYPFNPNGTQDGVAALCSQDGRHLAIMTHPERCFLPWQCPWMPSEMRTSLDVSPWMKTFQNAFDWSIQTINKARD